jgi:hypothetical protein
MDSDSARARVHSPLGIPAQADYVPPTRIEPGVNAAERLWDALAMLLIIAGTTLFLVARNGLASIANGTHKLPMGVRSFVQRADYFSAQSSLGLALIGIGVAVGLGASIRHALRRRAQRSTAAA